MNTNRLPLNAFIKQPLLEMPVVYHGGKSGITVFNLGKSTTNPAGVFLTPDKSYAASFKPLSKSALYKIEIPDNLVLLRWDYKYTVQSSIVQEILKSICINLHITDYEQLNGRLIYDKITQTLFGNDRVERKFIKTSKYLAANGIDGTVYDMQSKVYCIFNTEVIKVLESD